MKAARVFWTHLILWVGGVLAASLSVHAMLGPTSWGRLWWFGMGGYFTPYTAALLERIAIVITVASLPAGIGASRYVLSWSESWRYRIVRFCAVGVSACALVFILAGFVIPAAARSEDPSPSPRLQARGNYYSFSELLSESARFYKEANIGAKPGEGRTYNPSARWKSRALKQQFWFVIVWSSSPLLLAWIGVLIRLWSGLTRPQERALAEWSAALLLFIGIQVATSGIFGLQMLSHGAAPLQNAGSGREIFFVLVLVLSSLAWTTALARKHFRPLPG
jgi:type III secretory pathway component EscS